MIPFAKTGDAGTTLSHVVVPAGGRDRIRLQYVNATSDKAASLLTFKRPSLATVVTDAAATGQKVIKCVPYAGAAANDVVVGYSYAAGQAFRGVVASVQAGVSVTLTANLALALAPGDLVFLMAAAGQAFRGVVASVQAGVSLTLVANLALALAPGDLVFLMAAAGQIPVGAATKEANAPTVFAVDDGPALIELDGTSACRINLVAGEYF